MEIINLKNIDINQICRTCLLRTGTIPASNENLQPILRKIFNIEIFEHDNYPKFLCSDCAQKINETYLFLEQCQKSSVILQKYLSTTYASLLIKNEDDINVVETLNPLEIEDAEESLAIEEQEFQNNNLDSVKYKTNKNKENKVRTYKGIVNVETVLDNGDVIYQCYLCKTIEKKQNDLIEHYRTHDSKLPYVCPQCGKKFRRPYNLNDHISIHRGIKLHKCNMCGKDYKTKSNLLRHYQSHINNPNISLAEIKNQLTENIPTEFEEKKNKNNINVQTVSETGEQIYKCYICKEIHKNQEELIKHYKTHDSTRPYVCPQCGQRYRHGYLLNGHVLGHKGSKQYCCDVCGRSYMHKYNLTIHYRLHTGILPYECKDCDKKFKHSTQLVLHRRVHTKEKPYMCPHCGLKMAYSSNMIEHIRTHTNRVPFQCSICEKSFSTKKTLKGHELNHTGTKKHVCEYCNKAFRKPSNLKLHVMTHTGDKPHVCEVCGKGFIQRHALKNHIIQHNEMPNTNV